MKRVIVVHCWGGSPGTHWYSSLKAELEKRGFRVELLEMPDTNYPAIEKWVPYLAKAVGTLDKDTILVGHSVGGQTIMRYLETAKGQAGGVIFVGGWFTLTNVETPTEKKVAHPWVTTPIDFAKVKNAARKIIAFFSDNDTYVPLENVQLFRKNLGAETIVEKNKGHFTEDDGITEVPEVLEAVLKLSR